MFSALLPFHPTGSIIETGVRRTLFGTWIAMVKPAWQKTIQSVRNKLSSKGRFLRVRWEKERIERERMNSPQLPHVFCADLPAVS